MSMQQLNAIASKILGVASTVQYSGGWKQDPTSQIRDSNTGLENLISCSIGYAFPLPSEPVASPKTWFSEQYSACLGAVVSLLGEQRFLNSELVAIGAQGVWLQRYCQMHDIGRLASFGQLQGGRVAGLSCVEDYCKDGEVANSPLLFSAIEQIGKLVSDFHLALAKDSADA